MTSQVLSQVPTRKQFGGHSGCGRTWTADYPTGLKRGFQPTQRKERNEMTSLLDDGGCRWHATKLWQTHTIKSEITEIKFELPYKLHNK